MWLLTVSNDGGIFQFNIDPEHTKPLMRLFAQILNLSAYVQIIVPVCLCSHGEFETVSEHEEPKLLKVSNVKR